MKEKVFFKRESKNHVEVFYDVTDQLGHLPTYMKSIAVCFDSYITNKFMEDDAYIEENFKCFFNNNTIEEGKIQCNAEKVLITFVDGFQMISWNSECGGIGFIPPQNSN